MTVSLNDIRQAAELLTGRVLRTPATPSYALSVLSGADVVLKLESLQHTSSFKVRGALVKLLSLTADESEAGVVAASAGNHAQGVAFFARQLNIPATIYMPHGTAFTKVQRTESYNATVVLEGNSFSETREAAGAFAQSSGRAFIHPFDDEKIIAGQGTIALELLEDFPDLDTLIVPIGGGGLIAGCAVAAKALKPDLDVIGVQAELYPSMKAAYNGQDIAGGQTVAEGIAVKSPGELTRPVVEELVSDILLVSEQALENAVQVYLETQRLVVEGAGAASLAALMENAERFKDKKVGLVVSGGNMDSRLLSSILMRGLIRQGRMARLRISLPDQPGMLAKVSTLIGEQGGNIIEVYHQRLFYDIPVKLTDLDVVIETLDTGHVGEIIQALNDKGYKTRLLGGASTDL